MCQQTGPKHRQAVHKSPAGSVQRKGCSGTQTCRFEEDGAELHHLSVGGGHFGGPMILAILATLCFSVSKRHSGIKKDSW
ncbi:hypothetical protein Hamer_G026801 [Homarus americanus]|uniref:Uncharacterized protein n=1 Tax=Homarus americanus TaxID=6706 RepID=A0A8J5JR52_HOMAM|nr:hypothetical protein Hamer_G026801 [Homarus americanus]